MRAESVRFQEDIAVQQNPPWTREDAVPADVCRLCSNEMLRLIYPLWVKCVLRIEEPLAWKGGCLSELWKGKGALHKCNNSRGILVSDSAGKNYHTWLRRLSSTSLDLHARELQCGGRKGFGTDVCAHVV